MKLLNIHINHVEDASIVYENRAKPNFALVEAIEPRAEPQFTPTNFPKEIRN